MQLRYLIIPSLLLTTLAGCATTQLTSTGQEARVLHSNQVGTCKYLGMTTVQVPAKIIGISLPKKDVEHNLQILARNALQNVNGDTIVPVAPKQGGTQTFRMYRCVNP